MASQLSFGNLLAYVELVHQCKKKKNFFEIKQKKEYLQIETYFHMLKNLIQMEYAATTFDKHHKPITVDPNGRRGNPFDYGSGFVNPRSVLDPGLVYDAHPVDNIAFLCSIGYDEKSLHLITGDNSTCYGSLSTASDLNYPSITVPNLKDEISVTRTVTNVGGRKSIYKAVVTSPVGINVTVVPDRLVFNSYLQKIKFRVNFKVAAPSKGKGYSFGYLSWRTKSKRVTSPLVVRVAPSDVGLVR